jgi:hypothetical protein|tara:strand:- start:3008 stop:3895 length:888 start_codon:yes stop_codon:yes gene_type:complete
MNIKDMIAKMDAIDAPSKKQELTESASMNISMTADDAGQVGQLMAMMRNAGMDAKPVDAMHSLNPRADIEKFRATVDGANDDPGIPGQDNVPGDQDLQAGVLGTLAGGAAGAAGADALDTATGGVASTATGAMGAKAGAALGSLAGPAGAAIGGALGGIAGKMAPKVAGAAIGGALGDKVTGEETDEDYANAPDEQYGDVSDVIRGGTDLNKSKKSHAPVAGGDNPMALASKIKEELSTLYKEYTGESIVKEGGVKAMMQDCEEGMSKAEFEKKYPGADYAEVKQDIKDNAEENN